MIAVVAPKDEHPAIAEFFQLFKTPWCFYDVETHCDALLVSNAEPPVSSAKLVLIYGSGAGVARQSVVFRFGSDRLPIYGACATFPHSDCNLLTDEGSGESAVAETQSGGQTILRLGFDLFAEVRRLLGPGQPASFARIPTLDLHVELLRELLVRHSVPFAEIPPVPLGYNFTACLTHDVDHPRLRNHLGDHTMVGFLFRATIGSVIDWSRGRKTFQQVARNFRAALLLPFIYLGWARDIWDQFERYLEIEESAKSTFFVIPKANDPGLDANGRRQAKRAARYHLKDLAASVRRVLAKGGEIAVHGIDAWRDSTEGTVERDRVQELTGANEMGVRMHWLFWNQQSPVTLEKAGFSYDSTIGYNDAVGYRAGTTQVFKPLTTDRLLELPLHLMDTALFYPSHLNLSPAAARTEINALIENAVRLGGVLTVNWHDRSLAPERLWDRPYLELVAELKRRGAWMPTAGEAVRWFRERRAAALEPNEQYDGPDQFRLPAHDSRLPGFRLRTHSGAEGHVPRFDEEAFPVNPSAEFQLQTAAPHRNAA